MTFTAADVEPEDLRTIKRKPWLLSLTSQKKQLGNISILVIHITALLYFLIFIMVLVLVFELLKEYSGLKFGGKQIAFNENVVRDIIEREIQGPGSMKRYRSMHQTLKQSYKVHVPRDSVRQILKETDPNGTEERKWKKLKIRKYFSAKPKETWHMDGFDKLKPYGFPIHGCADGFSRRIMWLKVTRSNNNPVVPALYCLETVSALKLCPTLLQSDCGTENNIAAGIQCHFANDISAHKYGSSPSNQRIENFWSHYKRGYSSWIKEFFKDFVDSGQFHLGNYVHMECASLKVRKVFRFARREL